MSYKNGHLAAVIIGIALGSQFSRRENPECSAAFRSDRLDAGEVIVRDPATGFRATIGANDKNTMSLRFVDAQGRLRLEAGLLTDDRPGLLLSGIHGDYSALVIHPVGGPQLVLGDLTGGLDGLVGAPCAMLVAGNPGPHMGAIFLSQDRRGVCLLGADNPASPLSLVVRPGGDRLAVLQRTSSGSPQLIFGSDQSGKSTKSAVLGLDSKGAAGVVLGNEEGASAVRVMARIVDHKAGLFVGRPGKPDFFAMGRAADNAVARTGVLRPEGRK